jgi:hypothetical protein
MEVRLENLLENIARGTGNLTVLTSIANERKESP